MHQDDDHDEFIEESASISQKNAPDPEDEMIEEEIGGLMDQLTQRPETEANK